MQAVSLASEPLGLFGALIIIIIALLFFGVAILGLMGFLFWVAFRKPPPPGADTSAT